MQDAGVKEVVAKKNKSNNMPDLHLQHATCNLQSAICSCSTFEFKAARSWMPIDGFVLAPTQARKDIRAGICIQYDFRRPSMKNKKRKGKPAKSSGCVESRLRFSFHILAITAVWAIITGRANDGKGKCPCDGPCHGAKVYGEANYLRAIGDPFS